MNCTKEKYFIQTFGCQMNVHDSEVMSGLLEKMGFERASAPEEADIILLNTCCVRENAENRLYGHLGNLKPIKDQRPEVIIGVCGCMVQQNEQQERIRDKFPYIDLVFGTHNLHRLTELIQRIRQAGGGRIFEVWDEGERAEDLPARRDNPYQAWVNIIYGCNNFCTYCIVPYVRGREKSRQPEKILAEIERLAEEGVKELTLLGQNVNSYGLDFPDTERMDFPDLLAEVNKIGGLSRIRFQTSHPKDLSDKLISEMAEGEKICEHIHLPVQAGSDKILAAMNRKYTREHYLNLIRKLRAAIPNITITTDLIVGFPGEEEADFADTLSLVKEVGYDGAFTFAYSPRTGTRASSLPGQVEEEVKMERLHRLIEVTNELAKASNLRQVGKVEKILVEGPSEKRPEIYSGRTRGNKLVLFDPNTHSRVKRGEELIGEEVSVLIEEGLTYTLKGRVTE